MRRSSAAYSAFSKTIFSPSYASTFVRPISLGIVATSASLSIESERGSRRGTRRSHVRRRRQDRKRATRNAGGHSSSIATTCRARLRRHLPPADSTSIGHTSFRKAKEQYSLGHRGAGRRRKSLGNRQRTRRPHRNRTGARFARRLRFASSNTAATLRTWRVALDYALQCSPDHPWVREHPEWFHVRFDGTIKYAENPPKKYQDIYPLNFWCADRQNMWNACRDVVAFWIGHGVTTFRVDNPHTKPFAFWEWMIQDIQREHPDTVFFSEAFTRPKRMKELARIGFTMSYTYFTWKNSPSELREYFEELTQTEAVEYFRGNLFANTPDILNAYLVTGGRPAFRIRLLLAATLLPLYGIYSGFELCENAPAAPGSEEYQDSEKYQLRPRNMMRPATSTRTFSGSTRFAEHASAAALCKSHVPHERESEYPDLSQVGAGNRRSVAGRRCSTGARSLSGESPTRRHPVSATFWSS